MTKPERIPNAEWAAAARVSHRIGLPVCRRPASARSGYGAVNVSRTERLQRNLTHETTGKRMTHRFGFRGFGLLSSFVIRISSLSAVARRATHHFKAQNIGFRERWV